MQEGFFSPDSEIWRVDREMALLIGGGRALLMQLAHPKVAAGVAGHSDFREDPLGRLHRTMDAMWTIVFEEAGSARAALERIKSVHGQVRGAVSTEEPACAGMPYDALDQELLLWVHATLIDTAIVAYEILVRPLGDNEKIRYYEDSKALARLFEIRDAMIPASLEDFRAYMECTIGGPAIAVGPAARTLARDILQPRPWRLRPAGPLFRLLTAGMLPEKLRRGYGLPWSHGRERRFRLAAWSARHLLPLTPSPLRVVPHARRAERRLRARSAR